MKIKVDHDVLELTSYEILGNAKEFEDVLKVWNDNILQLPNIWQGEEANEFYLNMGMYLEQLKEIPNFYFTMSEFLKDANLKYRTADSDSRTEFFNKMMENDKNV